MTEVNMFLHGTSFFFSTVGDKGESIPKKLHGGEVTVQSHGNFDRRLTLDPLSFTVFFSDYKLNIVDYE